MKKKIGGYKPPWSGLTVGGLYARQFGRESNGGHKAAPQTAMRADSAAF
jgi:hypothetical protein